MKIANIQSQRRVLVRWLTPVATALGALLAGRADLPAQARPAAAPATAVVLQPCRVPGTAADARCGTYEVFENRQAGTGRKLLLNIMVLPALQADAAPDPLLYLAGGPGEAATPTAPFFLTPGWAGIRQHRDIVLVDQRGTGKSNPLTCSISGVDASMRALYAIDVADSTLQSCRRVLEQRADLRLYTTPLAVDDLDEVRAALGYDRINLYGGSYGTRTAFVYLRRHGTHVRSAVLRAIAPVDMKALLPQARHLQQSLGGLIEDCARDANCSAQYPHIGQDLDAVLAKLAAGPVRMLTTHPRSGQPDSVAITRDVFAGALSWMLASPEGRIAALPLIRRAAAGDYQPFLAAAKPMAVGAMASWGLGMALTVLCSEDASQITERGIVTGTTGTFMGDGHVRNQIRSCREWPKGWLPPGEFTPVRSDVPILMISGQYDPIDGLDLAEGAARLLPHALHVIVPHGTHQPQFPGCLLYVASRFLAQGSPRGLDVSCVQAIGAPAWPAASQQSRAPGD